MRVPARIFATEKMLNEMLNDRSLSQLANIATLPGIVGMALAMPDAHEGYGFPIGGVAATEYPNGVISPGGIGYDINCGVRLLRSSIPLELIKKNLSGLCKKMYKWIPSGVGKSNTVALSIKELDQVLTHGAGWMVAEGFGEPNDLLHIESQGRLKNADPSKVSDFAKKRGLDQLGTLGSGNHFAEIDYVEEIYDEQAAQTFGLFKNQVVVLIHTGSRGLGHQVATDYIRIMMDVMEEKYGITVPDRELACVPLSSPEGTNYFHAMAAAANFAWANRQKITWAMRKAWHEELGGACGTLNLVYDVAHNIAKIETHTINGKQKKLIVHRKGATRAFGPGHEELAPEYRAIGQPVLIPGSMGTASYVLAGTNAGMLQSFGSSCHGAGRRMSRHAAKNSINGKVLHDELFAAGIHIKAGSIKELAEEAPQAYKDIDEVVHVVDKAGIARKVARLRPCAVIKG
ncbi:RtcB family protein [Candidatus Babeliales bacterium]|nr:RtcB family protein [Candidatus Babeliales bacterium]